MINNRKIILEDGQQYCGLAFGDEADKVCELVFNTRRSFPIPPIRIRLWL